MIHLFLASLAVAWTPWLFGSFMLADTIAIQPIVETGFEDLVVSSASSKERILRASVRDRSSSKILLAGDQIFVVDHNSRLERLGRDFAISVGSKAITRIDQNENIYSSPQWAMIGNDGEELWRTSASARFAPPAVSDDGSYLFFSRQGHGLQPVMETTVFDNAGTKLRQLEDRQLKYPCSLPGGFAAVSVSLGGNSFVRFGDGVNEMDEYPFVGIGWASMYDSKRSSLSFFSQPSPYAETIELFIFHDGDLSSIPEKATLRLPPSGWFVETLSVSRLGDNSLALFTVEGSREVGRRAMLYVFDMNSEAVLGSAVLVEPEQKTVRVAAISSNDSNGIAIAIFLDEEFRVFHVTGRRGPTGLAGPWLVTRLSTAGLEPTRRLVVSVHVEAGAIRVGSQNQVRVYATK